MAEAGAQAEPAGEAGAEEAGAEEEEEEPPRPKKMARKCTGGKSPRLGGY